MTQYIIQRKRDGAWFKSSYPENWTDADAIMATFSGRPNYYFRRVKLERRWWQWRPSFRLVWPKEVWEPTSISEFWIFEARDAVTMARMGIRAPA